MIHRQAMGKEGMVLALLTACAMFLAAYFFNTPNPLQGDLGICLPSPNRWGMTPLGGWILNTSLMLLLTLAIYLVNKEFQLVQGSDTVLPGMFIVMAASNPWVSEMLSSSAIMGIANILCLSVLFGCYRKRNSTQQLFLIATILSLGTMIQYAFIFLTPVYLIGAIMLKCFNFKAFVAFLMGLAAPYWVGIGLGIIPLDWFTMPTITNLFDGYESKSGLFIGILNISVTVLIGFILAVNNGVKLYAGNTERRLYNMVANLLGVVCTICMLIDFNNLVAYLVTLYMLSALQLANLFALWNIRRGALWLLAIGALYVSSFIVMTGI